MKNILNIKFPKTLDQVAMAIADGLMKLAQYPDRTEAEVEQLAAQMSFLTLKDPAKFARWAEENRVSLADAFSLLGWANSIKDFLVGVDVDGDPCYDDVHKAYSLAHTNSILLHRVNYLLHEQVVAVYELLEKDKRFKFMVKKHYQQAEDCWERYNRPRQRYIERAAWCTLQDHLRLSADALQPRLQRVYVAARDRMIFLGLKDVELRSRIVVALTVGKVQHLSFQHFFDDFKRETHCDFRRIFAQDDITPMTRCFADMVQALGIAVKNDSHGMPTLVDFDIEQSVRTGWAWSDFMRDLRDLDLMDDAARRAIDLNPQVQKDYYAVLHEAEEEHRRQVYQEMSERLQQKFKVGKL